MEGGKFHGAASHGVLDLLFSGLPSSPMEGSGWQGWDPAQILPNPSHYGGSRSLTLFNLLQRGRERWEQQRGWSPTQPWPRSSPANPPHASRAAGRQVKASSRLCFKLCCSRSPDPLPQTSGLIRACDPRAAHTQLQPLRAATDPRRGTSGFNQPSTLKD